MLKGSVCRGNKFVDNSLFYFKPVECLKNRADMF